MESVGFEYMNHDLLIDFGCRILIRNEMAGLVPARIKQLFDKPLAHSPSRFAENQTSLGSHKIVDQVNDGCKESFFIQDIRSDHHVKGAFESGIPPIHGAKGETRIAGWIGVEDDVEPGKLQGNQFIIDGDQMGGLTLKEKGVHAQSAAQFQYALTGPERGLGGQKLLKADGGGPQMAPVRQALILLEIGFGHFPDQFLNILGGPVIEPGSGKLNTPAFDLVSTPQVLHNSQKARIVFIEHGSAQTEW